MDLSLGLNRARCCLDCTTGDEGDRVERFCNERVAMASWQDMARAILTHASELTGGHNPCPQ